MVFTTTISMVLVFFPKAAQALKQSLIKHWARPRQYAPNRFLQPRTSQVIRSWRLHLIDLDSPFFFPRMRKHCKQIYRNVRVHFYTDMFVSLTQSQFNPMLPEIVLFGAGISWTFDNLPALPLALPGVFPPLGSRMAPRKLKLRQKQRWLVIRDLHKFRMFPVSHFCLDPKKNRWVSPDRNSS